MNRVKSTAKRWTEARPHVVAMKEERRVERNKARQPKTQKDPNKL